KWQWFALRNVPIGDQHLSYFAVRLAANVESEVNSANLTLFGVGEFESYYPTRFFKKDCTQELFSMATDVASIAFADEVGGDRASVVLLLGSMSNEARIVPLETGRLFSPSATYAARVYLVEQGGWRSLGRVRGKELAQFAAQIEAGEFRLYEFKKSS
ncbi:MAG TPA: hypothetical protein VFW40_02440, partial [Capsulimonadaceae bacterium]|nr:hypothetical protein [Capsulimonadaceae bacterium]